MTNLLEETKMRLALFGKTPQDVIWVGRDDSYGTWDEFAANADFRYDAGFGGNEIHLELKIVGADWWMERHEYDGSEWWEYKSLPVPPPIDVRKSLTKQSLLERWSARCGE